eukprot:8890415-Alexandrium_andersonii.AAC.1
MDMFEKPIDDDEEKGALNRYLESLDPREPQQAEASPAETSEGGPAPEAPGQPAPDRAPPAASPAR